MEEENSWLDTETIVHKNIKSVRPEYKKKINKLEMTISEINDYYLIDRNVDVKQLTK